MKGLVKMVSLFLAISTIILFIFVSIKTAGLKEYYFAKGQSPYGEVCSMCGKPATSVTYYTGLVDSEGKPILKSYYFCDIHIASAPKVISLGGERKYSAPEPSGPLHPIKKLLIILLLFGVQFIFLPVMLARRQLESDSINKGDFISQIVVFGIMLSFIFGVTRFGVISVLYVIVVGVFLLYLLAKRL